ncbi:MAG: hypothetical protein IJ187_08285 [Neisseriaceae bacterium]|nr:hypothetical protein [Neisseriaceae bacterium]
MEKDYQPIFKIVEISGEPHFQMTFLNEEWLKENLSCSAGDIGKPPTLVITVSCIDFINAIKVAEKYRTTFTALPISCEVTSPEWEYFNPRHNRYHSVFSCGKITIYTPQDYSSGYAPHWSFYCSFSKGDTDYLLELNLGMIDIEDNSGFATAAHFSRAMHRAIRQMRKQECPF